MKSFEYEVSGDYALFSEPCMRVGGGKTSYFVPTRSALTGITENIYWKPTFRWVVDKVRILNKIDTETRKVRTIKYDDGGTGLFTYLYLKNVKYQVSAHIEWDYTREDLAQDRNFGKHFESAERFKKCGGRYSPFLGTSECWADVYDVAFGNGEGYYDNSGDIDFGRMLLDITYDNDKPSAVFWNCTMHNGVITFPVNYKDCEKNPSLPSHGIFGSLLATAETFKDKLPKKYHVRKTADIEVTIDINGNFKNASTIDTKSKDAIIDIPVTIESSRRSGKHATSHPLCDKVKYMDPEYSHEFSDYTNKLKGWNDYKNAHPYIKAIYSYVSKGTAKKDVVSSVGDIKDIDAKLVSWNVVGGTDTIFCACKNPSVADNYIEYYNSLLDGVKVGECYITGEKEHVINATPPVIGTSHLISMNDDKGFTYRGRFVSDEDAAKIGFESMLTVANTIKFLSDKAGTNRILYSSGDENILCWCPNGVSPVFIDDDFWGEAETSKDFVCYSENIKREILGYKRKINYNGNEPVVVLSIRTDTNGIAGIAYYNELLLDEYLNNIGNWRNNCCWYGKDSIKSPSLLSIIECAYGIASGGKWKLKNESLKDKHIRNLIKSVLNGESIDDSVVTALFNKVKNRRAYSEKEFNTLMFILCSVLNKNYFDKKGEHIMSKSLDDFKNDRSFQYGRLAALYEWIEKYYYYKHSGNNHARLTTSELNTKSWIEAPYTTYENVNAHVLQCYKSRLYKMGEYSKIAYFDKLKTEIMNNIFETSDSVKPDAHLTEMFTFGYSMQMSELYKSKEEKTIDKA